MPKQNTGSRKKENGMRKCNTVSRSKMEVRLIFSFPAFTMVSIYYNQSFAMLSVISTSSWKEFGLVRKQLAPSL